MKAGTTYRGAAVALLRETTAAHRPIVAYVIENYLDRLGVHGISQESLIEEASTEQAPVGGDA